MVLEDINDCPSLFAVCKYRLHVLVRVVLRDGLYYMLVRGLLLRNLTNSDN